MTNVLIIGGHGKVGLLAAPKLVDKGFQVTSLIRNPDQVPAIESLGANALSRMSLPSTPQGGTICSAASTWSSGPPAMVDAVART